MFVDVIFEGGLGKCDEEDGVNFSLKLHDVIYGRPLTLTLRGRL